MARAEVVMVHHSRNRTFAHFEQYGDTTIIYRCNKIIANMPEEILKINLFSSKRIPCGGEKLKSPHWQLSQAAAADKQLPAIEQQ